MTGEAEVVGMVVALLIVFGGVVAAVSCIASPRSFRLVALEPHGRAYKASLYGCSGLWGLGYAVCLTWLVVSYPGLGALDRPVTDDPRLDRWILLVGLAGIAIGSAGLIVLLVVARAGHDGGARRRSR